VRAEADGECCDPTSDFVKGLDYTVPQQKLQRRRDQIRYWAFDICSPAAQGVMIIRAVTGLTVIRSDWRLYPGPSRRTRNDMEWEQWQSCSLAYLYGAYTVGYRVEIVVHDVVKIDTGSMSNSAMRNETSRQFKSSGCVVFQPENETRM
jgi:hypothetical protein